MTRGPDTSTLSREAIVAAMHDVASQYTPRVSDYMIQRFADRILHEAAKQPQDVSHEEAIKDIIDDLPDTEETRAFLRDAFDALRAANYRIVKGA